MIVRADNKYRNESNNIYPKTCTHGCGLQIYWNTSTNEYFEVLLSVIQNSPDDEMSKTMLNYYDVWKDISNYP